MPVSDYQAVVDLAVDADAVYWLSAAAQGTSAAVRKKSKSGDHAVTLAASEDGPGGLALDETYVYWLSQSKAMPTLASIQRVPKTGGDIQILIDNASAASGPAVDSENIWWANNIGCGGDRIMRTPKAGGDGLTIAKKECLVRSLAIASGRVYWTATEPGTPVKSVLLDGSDPKTVVVSGPLVGRAIMATADSVYWTAGEKDTDVGSVFRLATTSDTPELVADGQTSLQGVTAVASTVFWIAGPSGDILYVPQPAGGSPVPFVSGSYAKRIVSDGVLAYWITSPSDAFTQILSLPLP